MVFRALQDVRLQWFRHKATFTHAIFWPLCPSLFLSLFLSLCASSFSPRSRSLVLHVSPSLDVFGLECCLTFTGGERRALKGVTTVDMYELCFVCPGYGERYYRSNDLPVVRFCPTVKQTSVRVVINSLHIRAGFILSLWLRKVNEHKSVIVRCKYVGNTTNTAE